jgi:hypothetical protein
VIDAPLAEWLAQGRVVIQYRAVNVRIVPVFGPNALDVSPRIRHIHVTVDDGPWRWADASGEPLISNCLLPGPYKVPPCHDPRVLHRSATQDSKGAAAGGIAALPRDSQAKSGAFASMNAGATLHPAQRSPCYAVQDR